MLSKNTLLKLVNLALTLALTVFAYIYFTELTRNLSLSDLVINWYLLVASGVAFLVFYGILSLHWVMSVKYVANTDIKFNYLAFFASQPYKYLPSSLFTFSFRAVYAKKLGLGIKKSSLAQLIENISMLVSNFVLFGLLMLLRQGVIYVLAVMALLILLYIIFLKFGNKEFSLKGRAFRLEPKDLLRLGLISLTAWLVAAFSFVILNSALGIRVDMLAVMAANTIAFSLGILVFFAPGGIGVREFVYGTFSVSASAILLWRILTFVLDFVFGLLAIVMINRLKSNTDQLNYISLN